LLRAQSVLAITAACSTQEAVAPLSGQRTKHNTDCPHCT